MPGGSDFAIFDGDTGNALLLTDWRRSFQLDAAADPAAVFSAIEAAVAGGEWVALAADYALGASFEPAVNAQPSSRPVLRAWVFARGEWLDAQLTSRAVRH